MSTRWVEPYLLIPFLNDGRDINGCDCWGLVRLIMKNKAHIDVPSYGEVSGLEIAKTARSMIEGFETKWWKPVEKPNLFDVVVMRRHGMQDIGHAGIMVNDKELVHTEKKSGPVMVSIDMPQIKSRIRFIRRHVELT